MSQCLVCSRINHIKSNNNPFLVKEFKTGYLVLGDYQFFRGYCLFLFKEHITELHLLDQSTRIKFLEEMTSIGEAVYKTFKPEKLNYELLGNGCPHIHWHIFPRYKTDAKPNQPVWQVSTRIRLSKKYRPNEKELALLKNQLLKNLNSR